MHVNAIRIFSTISVHLIVSKVKQTDDFMQFYRRHFSLHERLDFEDSKMKTRASVCKTYNQQCMSTLKIGS